MKILVTGGAGYIGSHTCVELLSRGFEVVILDNYCNSKPEVINRIREITGKTVAVYNVNVLDRKALDRIFTENDIEAVIHFMGLKAVGESVAQPLYYYQNNVTGTMVLCEAMNAAQVKNIVFSSSATIYGEQAPVPYVETMLPDISFVTNPYGRTKLVIEEMLRDVYRSDPEWNIAILRYFNPIGAHESGKIGEDPKGIPHNLMPYIAQVASGQRDVLSIFGDDYDTPDGTGIRDYIHVVDLAVGHVKALEWLRQGHGVDAINLGTGIGYSVLDVVKAFEAATGKHIPYQVLKRRSGDLPCYYADVRKAKRVLGWEAALSVEKMCEDTWRWQSQNPEGYK